MHVAEALSEANIVVDEETIVDCFLSLKTRPLLILTGVSGTGKTKLAQLLAKSLSAPSLKIISKEKDFSAAASDVASSGNVAFVPVRPDWTDNRQVLGFHNVLNNTFQVTPILELLAAAIRECEHAHFVILDEMNLARVEHYFSDLLSCLESRYLMGDKIEQEPLLLHNAGPSLPSQWKEESQNESEGSPAHSTSAAHLESVPRRMEIGVNCFFIGTVNVDETTYMFSPKVLDRANVIEVETPSVTTFLSESGSPKGLDTLKKVPLTSEELSSSGSFPFTTVAEARDAVSERAKAESFDFLLELQQLHQILGLWQHEFGPRVMRDFIVYATKSIELSDKSASLSNEERARLFGLIRIFDACTAQKVLPKIHGSKRVIEELLQTLLGFCTEGYDTGAHAGVLNTRSSPRGRELTRKDFSADDYRFPRSARKIHGMLRQLDAMNYASFIR
jgi:energy-coupling factor transporter ATP-binding protein EcfA2